VSSELSSFLPHPPSLPLPDEVVIGHSGDAWPQASTMMSVTTHMHNCTCT